MDQEAMSSPKHQAPRGTRDLLPEETPRWQWAESKAREVLEHYAYREIRTPLFEDFELFARTSGQSSDVVQKEMYRFKDLKGRDLALRPEATAGVCRAYLEHNLAAQGRVHRLWYMGPMFRYGRPQKGRYRQFWQIGAEVIGTPSPGADVEIIALFVDIFEAWGFENLSVALNSVGTPATRKAYGDTLRRWLTPAKSKLSPDSQARLETNPLRVLDTKDEGDLEILAGKGVQGPMPRMLDVLDQESREHWDQVLAGLEQLGIAHAIDHGLVRGLDYYTRTAFEVHDRSLGAQSALGGGGRYDGLIEALGGPATPGVGFSIGLDRTLLALEDRSAALPPPKVLYVAATEGTRPFAPGFVRALRTVYAVDHDLEGKSLGAQMKAADKAGARLVLILGDDEWKKGEIVVKDLVDGTQVAVDADDLVDTIDRKLEQNDGAETLDEDEE
jgi:histidyl-tRNA synthetase